MSKAQLPEGTLVNVILDNGSVVRTVTRGKPWKLGHGAWVVALGTDRVPAGGFLLDRISIVTDKYRQETK